jgi:hypothetical protein
MGGVLLDWNPRHLYRSSFRIPQEMERFWPRDQRRVAHLQDAGGDRRGDATAQGEHPSKAA